MNLPSPLIDFRKKGNGANKARCILKPVVLVAGPIVWLSLRLILAALKKLSRTKNYSDKKRLVILGFGGLGNHLMLTPAISAIKRARPDLAIHLVSSSRLCAQTLEGNPHLDSISVLDITRLKRPSEIFKTGKMLRPLRPYAVLAAAGTNPIIGSVISLISGAKVRIGEDWLWMGGAYTHTIKSNPLEFEAKQNMELARQLVELSDSNSPDLEMRLTPFEKTEGRQWRSECGISDKAILVGIHAGSSAEQSWKRWDLENFLELACRLTMKKDIFVVFFLGPDEGGLADKLNLRKFTTCIIYREIHSIRKTAARISACDIFISNDSGLRQIAVALGVKSYGIFGPTSEIKNFADFGMHEAVVHANAACRPCHYTRWWLACGNARPCLSGISTDTLYNRIERIIPHERVKS